MKKDIIKPAFTLAEVLITLGIIGVVAAMTIPTLIRNTQDAEIKTAWKKAYSEASQAWTKAIQENGGVAPGTVGGAGHDKARWNAFKAQFDMAKDCATAGSAVGDCWAIQTVTPDSVPNGCSAWSSANQISRGIGFVSKDGIFWLVMEAASQTIAYVAVDVNGNKGPNQWNKDVFSLQLNDTGVDLPGVCTGANLGTANNNAINYLQN